MGRTEGDNSCASSRHRRLLGSSSRSTRCRCLSGRGCPVSSSTPSTVATTSRTSRSTGRCSPTCSACSPSRASSYRSGFFGPAERFLLSVGVDVQFVPSDFRGFISMLEQVNARVVASMATPPDADGWMSLSLHAGAHVAELRRAAADPDRICLLETSERFPRTLGMRTAVPPCDACRRGRHRRGGRLHTDQPGRCPHDARRGGDRCVRAAVHPRRRNAPDRHRRDPQHDRDRPSPTGPARATASTPRCSRVA